MKYASIITTDAINVVNTETGESLSVYSSQPGYDAALDAVREGDWDAFEVIARPAAIFEKESFADGRVELEGGVVSLDGRAMHGVLSDRMIDMVQDGFDVEPLARFMVNLDSNPSKRAVDELYGFLEASSLCITEDGHFVAYKKVREDYKDCHSGTFDNSPGTVCEMPRNHVDEDKNRTCSAGLHFCGREYLSEYPGARTMIVKINPADVVAIPADYNNHKGRTCKYEVIGELTGDGHDSWGGIDKDRPEEELEGSVFTGDGFDVTDDFARSSADVDLFGNPFDDLNDLEDDSDILPVYYDSRQDARDAARGRDDIKVADFGSHRDLGDRWATVPAHWTEGIDY